MARAHTTRGRGTSPGRQSRRLLGLLAVAALALASAAVAAFGPLRGAMVALCLLLGVLGLVGVELLSRVARVADAQRVVGSRVREILEGLRETDEAIEGLGLPGRLEVVERRLLASQDAERLRAGDRHSELMEVLERITRSAPSN